MNILLRTRNFSARGFGFCQHNFQNPTAEKFLVLNKIFTKNIINSIKIREQWDFDLVHLKNQNPTAEKFLVLNKIFIKIEENPN